MQKYTEIQTFRNWGCPQIADIEVRDSRTGYLIPARYGLGVWPDGKNCRRVAAVVVVIWKMPKYKEMRTFPNMGMSQNSRNRNFSEIKAPAAASYTRLPFHILLPQN